MPSAAEVSDQLTDIVVSVLGVDPADIREDSTFKSLGADSLTIVEIGEELGRRFGVYLRDDTINHLRTVKDAIAAITRHDGTGPGRDDAPAVPAVMTFRAAAATPTKPVAGSAAVGAPATLREPDPILGPIDRDEAWTRAKKAGRALGALGAVVGIILGIMFAMLMAASGIDDVALPPIPQATSSPEPTEEPEAEPSDAAPAEDATPEPTLEAESSTVAPGQRFALSGAFPELGPNEPLQIQFKEPGTDWEDFPVVSQTDEGGTFRSEIYTSRTGEREFRLVHQASGAMTPTVKVTIG